MLMMLRHGAQPPLRLLAAETVDFLELVGLITPDVRNGFAIQYSRR
jgi:hypothetical protein